MSSRPRQQPNDQITILESFYITPRVYLEPNDVSEPKCGEWMAFACQKLWLTVPP